VGLAYLISDDASFIKAYNRVVLSTNSFPLEEPIRELKTRVWGKSPPGMGVPLPTSTPSRRYIIDPPGIHSYEVLVDVPEDMKFNRIDHLLTLRGSM
jgi:hypothetical protein